MATSHSHDNPKLARTYDRLSDPQFEGGQELVERLDVKSGDAVLDVGCGTGRLTQWIAGRDAVCVVGIDPLPERVALARERAPGIRFEVGSAEDLAVFADASFDVVCLSAVFHWIEDKARALREFARVLRPRGRLGVTTLPKELHRAGTMAEVCGPVVGRPPYRERAHFVGAHDQGVTLTEMVTMLQGTGLDLRELHVVERTQLRKSGEEVIDFVESSTFGNFLSMVPEDLRPGLRADLVAAFEARRGPEGIAIRDYALLLVATRR